MRERVTCSGPVRSQNHLKAQTGLKWFMSYLSGRFQFVHETYAYSTGPFPLATGLGNFMRSKSLTQFLFIQSLFQVLSVRVLITLVIFQPFFSYFAVQIHINAYIRLSFMQIPSVQIQNHY